MNEVGHDSSEAFITLFLQHERRLWHFILALVPTDQDAEDVLQETAVVLWRKRDEFRPGTDFLAWARAIARNKVLECRRRAASAGSSLDEDVLEQLASEAEARAASFDKRQAAMQDCMQRLPQTDAELIRDRYVLLRPEVTLEGSRLGVIEPGKWYRATVDMPAVSVERATSRLHIERFEDGQFQDPQEVSVTSIHSLPGNAVRFGFHSPSVQPAGGLWQIDNIKIRAYGEQEKQP